MKINPVIGLMSERSQVVTRIVLETIRIRISFLTQFRRHDGNPMSSAMHAVLYNRKQTCRRKLLAPLPSGKVNEEHRDLH